MIPIYKTAKPDTIDAKHKKATYTVERIVNELSTDTYLYGNNGAYSGFNNITPVDHNGTSHGGLTKFCTLFASRINQKPGTALNCSPGHVSITSVEGIDWYLPITDFSDGPATITVDVNGGEGPNELGEDRFEYTVQPGQKTEVVETHFNPPTVAPPAKPGQEAEPGGPEKDNRTAQNVYSIFCGGGVTVLGSGGGKVNGTYTLIAIPPKGKTCNWLTRQVTVKDADVTDCNLSCGTSVPEPCTADANGNCINPDPIEPDKPIICPDGSTCTGEDCCPKTYCINVTMTGDKDQCTIEGDGCEKSPGIYNLTVKSKDAENYKPTWSSKKVTLVDKNVTESVECSKIDHPSCYKLEVIGSDEEKKNCPVTLPKGNCPTDGYYNGKPAGTTTNLYLPDSYKVTVTPGTGFVFKDSKDATGLDVTIGDSDETIDLTGQCKADVKAEIKIEPSGSLSVSYGGSNTTGTTPSISGGGGSYVVKGQQDATISKFTVVPSLKDKGWKLYPSKSDFWSDWGVTPESGKDKTDFTVTLSRNHFKSDCVYAEYTDKSAKSNSVCFSWDGLGGNDCGIKITSEGTLGLAAAKGTVTVTPGDGTLAKSVRLTKSGGYTATVTDLKCGIGYTISAAEIGGNYCLTPNPDSIASLDKPDEPVVVTWELCNAKGAIKYVLKSDDEKTDATIRGITANSNGTPSQVISVGDLKGKTGASITVKDIPVGTYSSKHSGVQTGLKEFSVSYEPESFEVTKEGSTTVTVWLKCQGADCGGGPTKCELTCNLNCQLRDVMQAGTVTCMQKCSGTTEVTAANVNYYYSKFHYAYDGSIGSSQALGSGTLKVGPGTGEKLNNGYVSGNFSGDYGFVANSFGFEVTLSSSADWLTVSPTELRCSDWKGTPEDKGTLKLTFDTNTNAIKSFSLSSIGVSDSGTFKDASTKTYTVPVGSYNTSVSICTIDAGGPNATVAKTKTISPTSITIEKGKTTEATVTCTSNQGGDTCTLTAVNTGTMGGEYVSMCDITTGAGCKNGSPQSFPCGNNIEVGAGPGTSYDWYDKQTGRKLGSGITYHLILDKNRSLEARPGSSETYYARYYYYVDGKQCGNVVSESFSAGQNYNIYIPGACPTDSNSVFESASYSVVGGVSNESLTQSGKTLMKPSGDVSVTVNYKSKSKQPTNCTLKYGYSNQVGSGANGRSLTLNYSMTCTGDLVAPANNLLFSVKSQTGKTMTMFSLPVGGKSGNGNDISGNKTLSYSWDSNSSGWEGTHYVTVSTTADYISASCNDSWQCSPY